MSFININNLKFSFNDQKNFIIDIPQLEIAAGEKIFLFGPSGCGKSTLLEIMAGVLLFKEGQVHIAGESLEKMTSHQKDQFRSQRIGYIFQNFNLLPYLNVYENITLPLHFNKKVIDQKNIEGLCQRLGILQLLNQNVNKLSVGQQQRAAVARALASQPELILADEPTSALDFDHRDQFLKLLFEVCSERKITLVFVSHDHSLKNLFDRSIAFHEVNKVVSVKV